MRFLLGLTLLALGCATSETADSEEPIASEDSALAALESEIGFDGAVDKLDVATLESVDAESRALEASGRSEQELDRTATRTTLRAVLKQRSDTTASPGLHVQFSLSDLERAKLNDLEQKLCRAHRIVCVRVALTVFKARSASVKAFPDGDVGGRIDCFRHTYWNAAMTRSVGADYAKDWADAHENGNPANQRSAKDRLLSQMDFFNNDVGRKIGKAHDDDSDEETKAAVKKAVESGDVRAVRYDLGDPNGKLVPSSQCSDTVHCG